MKLDYDEIVKDFNTEGVTLRKVTNKFVSEKFKTDIQMLRLVMTAGDGEVRNNSVKPITTSEFKEEIINQKVMNISDIFMNHEMPVSVWLGFIQNMIVGEFIRTVSNHQGTFLVSYDKTKEVDHFISQIEDIPEKDIIEGIKTALKNKIKSSTN